MKNTLLIVMLLSAFTPALSQNKWFSLYTDSAALVSDAGNIVQQMTAATLKADSTLQLNKTKAIKNTSPYLIYIDLDSGTVNLPFWAEVIEPQKQFFAEVAGGKKEGEQVFGLFFNGFYLTHELGHALAHSAGKHFGNAYDSEYDANKIAILYWRSAGATAPLEQCYAYAKKMLQILKNPIPENEDTKKYLTAHYDEMSSDPYKYGYIQFSQFVELYENKSLGDFGSYIRNYRKKSDSQL